MMGDTLGNMRIVARYEVRLLARNRVFLALAVLGLAGAPLALYGLQKGFMYWYQVALPCAIPAANAVAMGMAVSFLVVFAVGEWVGGERRADAWDALRVRPYGNGAYVMGRAAGVFLVLGVAALVEYAVVAAWHGVLQGTPFDAWLYLFYWATQTLPALAFMTGLAAWAYLALRHGFAAFVLLVGFFFADVYVLAGLWGGRLDYMGMSLPNVFSEVTGHADLGGWLLQRLWTAVAGMAFLCFAVLAVRRVDDSPRADRMQRVSAAVLVMLALGIGAAGFRPLVSDRLLRADCRAQCLGLERLPAVSVVSHSIVWEQSGGRMSVTDTIEAVNRSGQPIEEAVLWLNPGLAVEIVEQGGEALPFRQEGLAVRVPGTWAPGESRRWTVHYAGYIDERACCLHVPDSLREATAWSNTFLRYGKRLAEVSDDYVFLTPDCLWYPVGTVPYRSVPLLAEREFARFRLEARHGEGMVAVSQGRDSVVAGGTVFENGHRLAGLSLAVGKYSRRSLEVDGVLFEMYAFVPGGVFERSVMGRLDGITAGLREGMQRMERINGRAYPFRRFAAVETPASLCAYPAAGETWCSFVQPELVFLTENWSRNSERFDLPAAMGYYFGKGNVFERLTEWDFEMPDTVEVLGGIISAFMGSTFDEERDDFTVMSLGDQLRGREWQWCEIPNPWSVAPMFGKYVVGMHSEEFPGVIAVTDWNYGQWEKRFNVEVYKVGLPPKWRVVAWLSGHSFREALTDPDASQLLPELLENKGRMFHCWMDVAVGREAYSAFLEEWRQAHQFESPDFSEFAAAVEQRFGVQVEEIMHTLYEEKGLPTLLVRNLGQVVAGDSAYVVCDVWNPSECDGVVTCFVQKLRNVYEYEELGSRRVEAGACGRLAFAVDMPCTELLMYTNLSANLPGIYSVYFMDDETGEMEVERVEEVPPVWLALDAETFGEMPGEVVVDDGDEGFRVVSSKTKAFWEEGKYADAPDLALGNFRSWLPSFWCKAWGNGGENGFHVKVTGNGDSRVEWRAELPEGGEYELYVHFLCLQQRFQNLDSVHYCYGLEQGKLRAEIGLQTGRNVRECAVSVRSNDGYEDEFYFQMPNFDSAWVPVGRYVLDAGEVVLKLYDRGMLGRLIFADAVKWKKI